VPRDARRQGHESGLDPRDRHPSFHVRGPVVTPDNVDAVLAILKERAPK
jgi:hypothetical protein